MNDVKRYKANELDEEDVVLASDYDEAVKFAAEVTAYAERLQAERDAVRAEVEHQRGLVQQLMDPIVRAKMLAPAPPIIVRSEDFKAQGTME